MRDFWFFANIERISLFQLIVSRYRSPSVTEKFYLLTSIAWYFKKNTYHVKQGMTVLYFITKFIDFLGENQNTLMHNLYFFNLESKNENCNLHRLNEMTLCVFSNGLIQKMIYHKIHICDLCCLHWTVWIGVDVSLQISNFICIFLCILFRGQIWVNGIPVLNILLFWISCV